MQAEGCYGCRSLAGRVQEAESQLADAQATIAALQARVQELEEWKRIVTGAGTDQESVIRLAATEYTNTAVQCWKEANAKLESQLAQRTAECDALKLVNDTHMKTVMKLSHVVEQRTAELEAVKAELEQERVRLAGCLIAAEGGTKDIVKHGDYGWSPAYQATLNLQAELERVRGERDNALESRDWWRAQLDKERAKLTATSQPGGTHEL